MKKYILGLFLAILLTTNIAYAEVTTVPNTQEQYQQALVQLITLLQEQVNSLVAQLKEVQASQLTIVEKLNKPQEQTLPINQPNAQTVFGSTQIMPEVVKNLEITTEKVGGTEEKIHYAIKVTYTEDGVSKFGDKITIISDDNLGKFEHRDLTIPAEINNGLSSSPVIIPTKKIGDNIVSYVVYRAEKIPFTITASINGLTKSLTVN